VGVIQVCFISANGDACVFWVKWAYFECFLSFSENVDAMRVCATGADGPLSSCFWWFVCFHVPWLAHGSCSYLLFYVSKLLRMEILSKVLFPSFLLRCNFVASTDVVLYQIVLFT
jgi:hypothetical protein